jgi:hypothetical protein
MNEKLTPPNQPTPTLHHIMESEKIHGFDKKHYCDVLEMEYITIASEYARWSKWPGENALKRPAPVEYIRDRYLKLCVHGDPNKPDYSLLKSRDDYFSKD